MRREFDRHYGDFHEYMQTRGLGPYAAGRGGGRGAVGPYRQQPYLNDSGARGSRGQPPEQQRGPHPQVHGPGPGGYADRFPGGRGHESSRPHPSGGRGRGRAEGVGQFPPYNSPPNFPPNVPRGRFPNGPRHAFSANYSYGPGNMEYSGWGAATGHWSTPPEGAHGHGLGGYERSFGGEVGGRYGSGHPPDHGDYFQQPRPGERPYGDDEGRYSFGHPPYDGGSFKQQRETTGGESSNSVSYTHLTLPTKA